MEMQNLLSIKEATNIVNTYRTQIFTGIAIVAIAISGLIYWQFSRVQQEQNALQALSEILVEYNRAYENNELWQDVEVGARTGYRQYARSTLAPFFLGLQAEALMQQDKLNDAIITMDTMIKQLSTRSPFYDSYRIKSARMKLSSEDKVKQEEGLQELVKLAENQKKSQQQQAQYYLGLYYQDHDQIEKAHGLWKSLGSKEEKPDMRSVWAMMAEQQIKQG